MNRNFNTIDDILTRQVEKHHAPSVQYMIFDQNNIIHRFSYGLADIKKMIEPGEPTVYNWYSVTKTFTAIAILQLAEKNLLNIDHPVIEYLPGFPYSNEITIRQLLTHTAGIPNPVPLSWIHLAVEHDGYDRNEFFGRIITKNRRTRSKPNEKFCYSNLGYILLGQVIEQVSGSGYEDYIRNNLVQRLGILPEDLDFVTSVNAIKANGYHRKFSPSDLILGMFIDKSKYMEAPQGHWRPFKPFYVNGTPYGGLNGKTGAFVKYIRELLKPGCCLLSDERLNSMFTENRTNNGKPTGMCLAWFTGQLHGNTYFTHAGGGGGYYCELRIYRDLGIGSVMMMNRTGLRDERFLDKLDGCLIQEIASSK